MPRANRFTLVLIVAVLLITTAVPPMVVYAQDGDDGTCAGTGVFYYPCRLIDSLLNGVLNFFNFVINAVASAFAALGDLLGWMAEQVGRIFTFFGDIVRSIFDFIGRIVALINEMIQIVGLIIQIIWGFIVVLGGWLFQMVGIVAGILSTFFTTAPTAIPGAPLCASAPTAHEFCAVWYLTDNTVFSGGPGALWHALILIIVDVSIIFVFARKVMTLLGMGESVTNVD